MSDAPIDSRTHAACPCLLAYTCSLSAPSGPGTTQVRILKNSAKDGVGNMWCARVVKRQHEKRHIPTKANIVDRAIPVVVRFIVARSSALFRGK